MTHTEKYYRIFLLDLTNTRIHTITRNNMDTSKQSDPAIMPGVMQPGRLSQAQIAQNYIAATSRRREDIMKETTGIVRRIDDLGRVVIPKEIRRTLRIRE